MSYVHRRTLPYIISLANWFSILLIHAGLSLDSFHSFYLWFLFFIFRYSNVVLFLGNQKFLKFFGSLYIYIKYNKAFSNKFHYFIVSLYANERSSSRSQISPSEYGDSRIVFFFLIFTKSGVIHSSILLVFPGIKLYDH